MMFKHFNENIKVLLPLSLFVLTLLVITTLLSSSAYFKFNALKELKVKIDLSSHISSLLHETQKERGFSSAVIASHGSNLKKELIKQRKLTDLHVKELSAFIKRSHENIPALTLTLLHLKEIDSIRKEVDTLSISINESIKFYSDINDQLLSVIESISKTSKVEKITKQTEAYINFLYEKEATGLERAVGVTILTDAALLKTQRIKFIKLITMQDIYFKKFKNYADVDSIAYYNKTVQGNEINVLSEIRKVILSSNNSSDLGIAPKYWFETITKKIDKLQSVDKYLKHKILFSIKREIITTTRYFIFTAFINLMIILIFIALLLYIFKIIKRERKAKLLIEKYVISSATDLRGNITYASEAFCKISGYSREELIGKPHNIVRSPDTPKEVFKDIWKTIQNGEIWTGRIKNARKDGGHYWVYATIEPLLNNSGHIEGYAAVRIEITDSINLEEKIITELEKNKQKDKMMLQQSKLAQMGEMISMIAHQWRQPLTAISASASDLVLKNMLKSYERDYYDNKLKKINELSQHLSKTIDDFRGFYKEDKQKLITTSKEIVEGSLSIIQTTIKAKGIELKLEYVDVDVLFTYVNEVRQVVLNLLKNAEDVLIEKEIANPYIKINTYTKDEIVYIEISDNAGGIPKEFIDKIFEPYFTTKEKADGTGLGLYMSKTIIKDHCDGELIASNTKEGALFRIKLKKHKELSDV